MSEKRWVARNHNTVLLGDFDTPVEAQNEAQDYTWSTCNPAFVTHEETPIRRVAECCICGESSCKHLGGDNK